MCLKIVATTERSQSEAEEHLQISHWKGKRELALAEGGNWSAVAGEAQVLETYHSSSQIEGGHLPQQTQVANRLSEWADIDIPPASKSNKSKALVPSKQPKQLERILKDRFLKQIIDTLQNIVDNIAIKKQALIAVQRHHWKGLSHWLPLRQRRNC